MVYKLINSKVIVSRLFDEYNIDYSGFISRVPTWIYNAMRAIRVSNTLEAITVPGMVVNYKCIIPNGTEELIAITYNGFILPRDTKINEGVVDEMAKLYNYTEKYQLNNMGYIITTFPTGNITFYIKQFPTELDVDSNLLYPLIPNNEELFNAISWYILRNLLYRGHKITGLSLNAGNEFINPALRWEKLKFVARNSLATLDRDDMKNISNMIRSFLIDYNKYNNDLNPNVI